MPFDEVPSDGDLATGWTDMGCTDMGDDGRVWPVKPVTDLGPGWPVSFDQFRLVQVFGETEIARGEGWVSGVMSTRTFRDGGPGVC